MRVKNVNGTSGDACTCGSWLDHWKKFSNLPLPPRCTVVSCAGLPEFGAHVQKEYSDEECWYIVPFCKTHNAQTGKSYVVDTTLVPADVSETCGKQQ